MKPLVRFTMGNTHPYGFRILKLSVKSFTDLYQDQFDYVIVHNSLSDTQIKDISDLGVPLLEASYHNEIKYPPQDTKWKLYPQRLRPDSHEIVLDNDIIWFNKLRQIDEFLKSDKFLIVSGRQRNLGHYDKFVPKGMNLNSGILGYPPGFDLTKEICKIIDDEPFNLWQHWNDDQGIMATIILNTSNYIRIPLNEVTISYPEYTPCPYATHFCGINKGHVRAFNQYTNYGCLM